MLRLLVLASLTLMSYGQNVTTWHNDINRTGWQPNETILTQSNVGAPHQFGLLWQWPVTGYVFAQPLAVTLSQSVGTCSKPCSLVFVATEEDMLYAFNAASSSTNSIWSRDLAAYVGGSPVTCSELPPNVPYDPCSSGLLGPYVGVTGTPVIDTSASPNTLYVAAAVYFSTSQTISFYLFAVDITTGSVLGDTVIAGTVNGYSPGGGVGLCTSDFPRTGQIPFDYNHIQRSALLLLNSTVYVAFAPGAAMPTSTSAREESWWSRPPSPIPITPTIAPTDATS